jgi:hypothetical protein
MVSPIYKGGYGANGIDAVAPDGQSVAFTSLGAFAGDPLNNALTNDYIARRGASGWSTTPLMVPASLAPDAGIQDFSTTLDSSLSEAKPGPNGGSAGTDGSEVEFLSHSSNAPDTADNFEVAGMVLKTLNGSPFKTSYKSASPDFSHILFEDGAGPTTQLLPEAVGTESKLYDLATQSLGGTPSLRLVGLNNKSKPIERNCQAILGTEAGRKSAFNAIAADGKELFFTTGVSENCSTQLFARVGGSKTFEVSKSLACPMIPCPPCHEVPCPEAALHAPADFEGANEEGTLVFFTTAQPLIAGGNPGSNDLYMAEIGCPGGEEECEREPSKREVIALVQVSQELHAGEPAEVQGVVSISFSGSHVYFVARGVLSETRNEEGQLAAKGADNLYAYDSVSGGTTFVTDLCSGPEASGALEDTGCSSELTELVEDGTNDDKLWATGHPEAQTNSDGRFLVFSSYGQLIQSDTDTAKDVYRYDAETGALERVSTGEAGYDANGNNDAFNATIAESESQGTLYLQHHMNSQAITEDGTRIVFRTTEPLSPAAGNGLPNVYEWHEQPDSSEGKVSLVSTGSSDEPVEQAVISRSGADIFFKTSQGLIPQDIDGQSDIYDARLGGGFPSQDAPRQPCSGDACQGPLTNPAPLLIPGSASQAPGENFPSPASKAAPAKKKTKAKKKQKKAPAGKSRSKGKAKRARHARSSQSEGPKESRGR